MLLDAFESVPVRSRAQFTEAHIAIAVVCAAELWPPNRDRLATGELQNIERCHHKQDNNTIANKTIWAARPLNSLLRLEALCASIGIPLRYPAPSDEEAQRNHLPIGLSW